MLISNPKRLVVDFIERTMLVTLEFCGVICFTKYNKNMASSSTFEHIAAFLKSLYKLFKSFGQV